MDLTDQHGDECENREEDKESIQRSIKLIYVYCLQRKENETN